MDRLKNKNGISYDKRPRIPSSSNVCSVDFSFFFFFLLSLPRCVFFGLLATLFFFYFPTSILSPISRWSFSFLVSLMFRNPFFFSLTHPRDIHVLAARARGGKDRPSRRAVHPILRRPDK